MITTRPTFGAKIREVGGEKENWLQFTLATEIDRAIDLSCRLCGAMAMVAELGFPVGDSAPLRFHPQPPIKSFGVRSCLVHNMLSEK